MAPHTSTPGWPSKGQPSQSRLHFATNLRTPDSSKSVHIFACEMMSKEKILLKSQDFTTIPKWLTHSIRSIVPSHHMVVPPMLVCAHRTVLRRSSLARELEPVPSK